MNEIAKIFLLLLIIILIYSVYMILYTYYQFDILGNIIGLPDYLKWWCDTYLERYTNFNLQCN